MMVAAIAIAALFAVVASLGWWWSSLEPVPVGPRMNRPSDPSPHSFDSGGSSHLRDAAMKRLMRGEPPTIDRAAGVILVDDQGFPVKEAHVWFGSDLDSLQLAGTAEDGQLDMTILAGVYVASADGHLSKKIIVTTETVLLRFELPRLAHLTVQLEQPDASRLAGQSIVARRASELDGPYLPPGGEHAWESLPSGVRATTSDDGIADLGGLAPGVEWRIAVLGVSTEAVPEVVIRLQPGEERGVVIPYGPGRWIVGQLVDEYGVPIEGAFVHITAWTKNVGADVALGKTRPGGGFAARIGNTSANEVGVPLPEVKAGGELTLSVVGRNADGRLAYFLQHFTLTGARTDLGVLRAVSGPTFSGVVFGGGRVLSDANVAVISGTTNFVEGRDDTGVARTNAAGRFVIESAVPEGIIRSKGGTGWRVQVTCEGFVSVIRTVTFGESTEGLEIDLVPLPEPADLTVTVLGDVDWTAAMSSSVQQPEVWLRADGVKSFQRHGFARATKTIEMPRSARRYFVYVSYRDSLSAVQQVEIRPGTHAKLELKLEPGSFVHLSRPAGFTPGFTASIETADGTRYAGESHQGRDAFDARLLVHPTRDLQLVVRTHDGKRATIPLWLGSGETLEVDWDQLQFADTNDN